MRASILAGLHVWKDQPLCRETVEMIANDPASYATEAHQIVFDMRSWLNLGPVDSARTANPVRRDPSIVDKTAHLSIAER